MFEGVLGAVTNRLKAAYYNVSELELKVLEASCAPLLLPQRLLRRAPPLSTPSLLAGDERGRLGTAWERHGRCGKDPPALRHSPTSSRILKPPPSCFSCRDRPRGRAARCLPGGHGRSSAASGQCSWMHAWWPRLATSARSHPLQLIWAPGAPGSHSGAPCGRVDAACMCMDAQGIIHQRLQERGENWRLCYKALLLLDFLCKQGPRVSVALPGCTCVPPF